MQCDFKKKRFDLKRKVEEERKKKKRVWFSHGRVTRN